MKKLFFVLFVAFSTSPIFSQGNVLNYEDVPDLIASSLALQAGDVVRTRGYHNPNDGGSAFYTIENDTSTPDNGGDVIRINTNQIARLAKNQLINVKQFGAIGNNINNDTSSLQNAIDYCLENLIQDLRVPKGSYRIASTLLISNLSSAIIENPDRPSGLYIIGEGQGSTIFRNDGFLIGHPLVKVDGIAKDGSGGKKSTYLDGGGFKGITFNGLTKGNGDNHGLEIIAWWNADIEDCMFRGFKGDAIRVISDVSIDPNPDLTASVNLKFKNVLAERNFGYGFNDHGSYSTIDEKWIGQGTPHAIFEHCQFRLNQKGGAYLQSSGIRFISSSIAFNGWQKEDDTNTNVAYGLFYGGNNSTFNGRHLVQGCEFDNNKTAHIGINSMSNTVFTGNRFIHEDRNTVNPNPTKIDPSTITVIFDPLDNNQVIKNVEFRSNFFRAINRGGLPNLTFFDWNSHQLISHIYVEHNSFTDNRESEEFLINLTPYDGADTDNWHLRNNYVLRDNNFVKSKKVTSNGTPPSFYMGSATGLAAPNGSPAGNNMYNLVFDKPQPHIFNTVLDSTNVYNSFVNNLHYNTTTGVFTCPETGIYRIDVQITHLNVATNQRARLHVRQNGNLLFSDYVWGTGNYRLNLDISSTFFADKGDQITLETGRTGSGTVQLATPENYGFNRLNIRLEE